MIHKSIFKKSNLLGLIFGCLTIVAIVVVPQSFERMAC